MSDSSTAAASGAAESARWPELADPGEVYHGLAPFLRMSIGGVDLRPLAQSWLSLAGQSQQNPLIWMNLATLLFCLELEELALAAQEQALLLARYYRRPARLQPARFRLLMIMAPGNIAENTPLDCLFEDSQVELDCYYASPECLLPENLAEHDAVFVALSDSEKNRPLLKALEPVLAECTLPVLNRPEFLPRFNRDQLCLYLQDVAGLEIPVTQRLTRPELAALLDRPGALEARLGAGFPLIIRPLASHAGNGLARIDSLDTLRDYLAASVDTAFFLAHYVDYRSSDGQFRKYRVALLGGQAFICHMAISSHWMVHYVNAGMYDDAAKREEEQRVMQCFDAFAKRHAGALGEIAQRLGADYMCIDCAETRAGDLLIFEIDHGMVVHAMDSPSLFPFKPQEIAKLQRAFEHYLYALNDA